MLTPVDIQNKEFKGGIGFDKKEVETFINQVSSDYEILYRSNVELKDKVATLNESLQHYRAIEESMQKALTLSEKTAEETVNAANDKARLLSVEAEKKAESIVIEAREELLAIKNEIYTLQQQHDKFKKQFKNILETQLKILDGEMIDIDLGADFEPAYQERNFYSSSSYSGEGGLGGGLGGGYTGSNMGGFERTNQDPMFDRGSLNMDPFADAMNGGGRFSRQTGKGFVSNSDKKKKSAGSSSSLNMKNTSSKGETQRSSRVAPAKPEAETVAPQSQEAPKMASMQTEQAPKQQTRPTAPKPATAPQPTKAVTPNPAPQTAPKPAKPHPMASQTMAGATRHAYTGEVEDKVNESTMLDSEDNYSEGFDFISEETTYETPNHYGDNTYAGEVENKVNESTMLDSEDNYSEGFDFVSEDDAFSFSSDSDSYNEDTYSGEVEIKVNESTMLDSEDNYSEGFDFLVGNEEEEEDIPTIFPNTSSIQSDYASSTYEEDVYEGDIEDNINKSNLIGNDDNDDEGFNFL